MAKSTLSQSALTVHEKLVTEKVRRLAWLSDAALKNVQEAMQMTCKEQQDFRHRANTIKHALEVVDPQQRGGVAVQVNTNVAQSVPKLNNLTDQEVQMVEVLMAKAVENNSKDNTSAS